MSLELPSDDVIIGEHYYILASGIAADLPKLVLKHDDAFLVADRRGDFPHVPGSEFGFYVEGTRFLRHLDLRVFGQRPLTLNAGVSEDALEAAIDLTNPDVALSPQVLLPGRALRIARRVTLYGAQLYQVLAIESFADLHDLQLTLTFAADFVDVFEVRGHPRERRGVALPAQVEPGAVRLAYRGLDGVVRSSHLAFDPPPRIVEEGRAEWRISLAPGGRAELSVVTTAATTGVPARVLPFTDALRSRRASVRRLEEDATGIRTNHDLFDTWLARARRDLHMLLTDTPDGFVPYAGIPWYVAPFGRDAIITALQVLPFEPQVAAGTLRFLARHIGRVDDDFTDQQPGKILHEHRRGEMAACREIPFIPYYGSVDATPLFLMLLGEYARWTSDLDLVRDLWPAIEQALAWMVAAGDRHGRGYLEYERRSPLGLANQGWKDSHDAIMHVTGELAEPPIALAEVQGYQYAALLSIAAVAEMLGQPEHAPALRERAARLRTHFETDFWLPEEGFYALALDRDGHPCRVISSNPGHLLWTGIVAEDRAQIVTARLTSDEMFSGWGLRTLSPRERLYNPMSYHNGSVWPHDTAMAAAGMRRYGLTDAFLTLATGLFEAVLQFESSRLPELFCGFPRVPGHGPTRYPVACSPQAWAAGVVFQLVSAMLGLSPAAHDNQLTLNRPRLPDWLTWIELQNLRVHKSRFGLRVSQGQVGAAVELISREGDAELVVRR
ncbi:MAG: amylo-alpha-1,6-glucosidase [Candidatus Rokuibacteriota bacterium]